MPASPTRASSRSSGRSSKNDRPRKRAACGAFFVVRHAKGEQGMRHRRRSSDRMSPRGSGVFGALAGAAGVALAAYAAHAATGEAQRWLYTAAAMALVHGVLLVAYVPG